MCCANSSHRLSLCYTIIIMNTLDCNVSVRERVAASNQCANNLVLIIMAHDNRIKSMRVYIIHCAGHRHGDNNQQFKHAQTNAYTHTWVEYRMCNVWPCMVLGGRYIMHCFCCCSCWSCWWYGHHTNTHGHTRNNSDYYLSNLKISRCTFAQSLQR